MWRSEWLRLRGLAKWADYLDRMEGSLEQQKERSRHALEVV